MKAIDMTPSWETCAVIYAEAYANHDNPNRGDCISELRKIGRFIDYFNKMVYNDDGSVTLGSEDVKKLKDILR